MQEDLDKLVQPTSYPPLLLTRRRQRDAPRSRMAARDTISLTISTSLPCLSLSNRYGETFNGSELERFGTSVERCRRWMP